VHVHAHVHVQGGWVDVRVCMRCSQKDQECVCVCVLLFLQQPSIPHYSCSPAVTARPEDCAISAGEISNNNVLRSGLQDKTL